MKYNIKLDKGCLKYLQKLDSKDEDNLIILIIEIAPRGEVYII